MQKLHEIGTKSFQSVSDVLNELPEELGLEAVRAVTIDSTNGKLKMMVETQKIFKISRIEMKLVFRSSESQPKEKEDSPQGMYRVGKIRYTKNTVPWCSLIQNWGLPIAILVLLLILLFVVGCSGN